MLILVSPISGRAQEWKEPLSTRGINPTVVYGGSVFSDLAGGIARGETYSGLSGDAQGASNLSAPSQITLNECWFQSNLFESRFSVPGGRYDLGSEYYRLQTAGLFLNSSFSTGPASLSSWTRVIFWTAPHCPARRSCEVREH